MGMGIFEMVVWIVGISCLAGVASSWIKSGGGGGAELANKLERRLDEIDELEERASVLERVITDDRQSLNEEIQRLQD